MLYRCYGAAVKEKKFTELLADIQKRYQEIIEGLGITLSLDEEFATIRDNFAKKIGRDYAASRGEYLNGRVIAAYLGYEFIDAADDVSSRERTGKSGVPHPDVLCAGSTACKFYPGSDPYYPAVVCRIKSSKRKR